MAFSPDGTRVVYVGREKEALRKVPLRGGTPITPYNTVEFWGGSWGEGSSIVFVPSWSEGLMRVSAEGGTPEILLPAIDTMIGQTRPPPLDPLEGVLYIAAGTDSRLTSDCENGEERP